MKLPKALEQYAHVIAQFYYEEGAGYFVELKPGYWSPLDECHGIVESTVRGCAARLRCVEPCSCSTCKAKTMTNHDYQGPVIQFLANHGITFEVARVGAQCPPRCEDFSARRDLDKLETFPRDSHIHGAMHRVTFTRTGKLFTTEYWNSYRDELERWAAKHWWVVTGPSSPMSWQDQQRVLAGIGRNPKHPGARPSAPRVLPYDVLSVMELDSPGPFEEWCLNYGYDPDSRTAERIWRACVDEWMQAERFFTPEELDTLREIAR